MLAFVCVFSVLRPVSPASAADDELLVYIGTYTRGESQGIYVARLNLATGSLSQPEPAAETTNPSFLALHPGGRFLYAANEIGDFAGGRTGAVSAFSIDPTSGRLTLLGQQSSRGSGPCHLEVDQAGRNVLVANYGGGNVAVLPLREDGSLREASGFIQHEGSSVHPRRQQRPYAHSINLDPGNRFAIAADLGTDHLYIYRLDAAAGTLAPNDPASVSVKPGAGPRHFAFHPEGRRAYVINELDSTITAFNFDPARGALESIETVPTLPEGFDGNNSTAEVQVHPSGRFLYGSNRGHDSIVVFAIDPASGRLTLVEHQPTRGRTPRNFGIDPTGRYLIAANQNSNTLAVFGIDTRTGRLQPIGQPVEAPSPVCVKFLRRDSRP